ncbi:MAG: Rep family protein, partial [Cetobacterium sp.]
MAKNSKEVQKKADEKRAGERTRNWSFIVYPDSAPKNWVEIIQEERVPFVVSPIHDSDVNELTGELKKAH